MLTSGSHKDAAARCLPPCGPSRSWCFLSSDWLAELSDAERATEQRVPRAERRPLPHLLRQALRHQDHHRRGRGRDAQHPQEVPPGGFASAVTPATNGRFTCTTVTFTSPTLPYAVVQIIIINLTVNKMHGEGLPFMCFNSLTLNSLIRLG